MKKTDEITQYTQALRASRDQWRQPLEQDVGGNEPQQARGEDRVRGDNLERQESVVLDD